MRTVFTNSEVAHIWAKQTQPYGKGPSIYFQDATIYSYGRHFPIARFFDAKTVLFTTRSYSISTNKHISYTQRAIAENIAIVPCYNPERGELEENLRQAEGKITAYLKEASNARTRKPRLEGYAKLELTNVEAVTKLYLTEEKRKATVEEKRLLKECKKLINDMPKTEARLLVEVKQKNALSLQRKKEQAERKRQEEETSIIDWLSGKNRYFSYRIKKTFLRIQGEEVQTSKGARVPICEAKLYYAMLKSGKPMHGMKINGYETLSYVNGKLTIGCHVIEADEIARFGVILESVGN